MSKQSVNIQEQEFYSLSQIERLLLSKHKKISKEFAQQLFELIIPAVLDIEVDRLYKQSKQLLEESAKLAELSEQLAKKHIADITGAEELPKSCADCKSVQITFNYGDYELDCVHDGNARGQSLAQIIYAESFNRSPESNRKALMQLVQNRPIPIWCPRRNEDEGS
jgi:hypothetical protein